MIGLTEELRNEMFGDWVYTLATARDNGDGNDVAVVTWRNARHGFAWDRDGELLCPHGDNTPGDRSGAKVFRGDDRLDVASRYFDDMMAALQVAEN